MTKTKQTKSITGWNFGQLLVAVDELKKEYPYLKDRDFTIETVVDQHEDSWGCASSYVDAYAKLVYYTQE